MHLKQEVMSPHLMLPTINTAIQGIPHLVGLNQGMSAHAPGLPKESQQSKRNHLLLCLTSTTLCSVMCNPTAATGPKHIPFPEPTTITNALLVSDPAGTPGSICSHSCWVCV